MEPRGDSKKRPITWRAPQVRPSNSDGESLVSSAALADLFKVLKDNIRVVVLNACYSEEQAQAIVEEIDFVVGMAVPSIYSSARPELDRSPVLCQNSALSK